MTQNQASSVMDRLFAVILDRKQNPPAKSYVVSLLQGGVEKIGAKITEEAAEVVDAATETDTAHLCHECADLLFHLMVMMVHCDLPLDDVVAELERRFGVSGITEKEQRGKKTE